MNETPDIDPTALVDILSSERVAAARAAAERFGGRDEERLEHAREAFRRRR